MARDIWKGDYYKRGGVLKDKHGNTHTTPVSFRKRGYTSKGIKRGGWIVTDKGAFVGVEKNKEHHYAYDPKKVSKPETFVRPNYLGAMKPRRAHRRRL